MKHTKAQSIPRKNAVIKKPTFLRGISYFLIKMERIGISRFLHFESIFLHIDFQAYSHPDSARNTDILTNFFSI